MMATSSARSEPIGQGGCSRGKCARQPLDQADAPCRRSRCSTLMMAATSTSACSCVPAVVVGHHGDRRVANLGLAGELGLGHVGHADHVAAPAAVEVALGARRELRTFHDEVGAAARRRQCCSSRAAASTRSTSSRAHGIGHRHMRHAARPEEALLAREGAVDELVDQHEMPGRNSSFSEPQAETDTRSVTPARFRASMLAR